MGRKEIHLQQISSNKYRYLFMLANKPSKRIIFWIRYKYNIIQFSLISKAEGKVKQGNLRNNKSIIVYGTDDYVVSLCSNPEGSQLAAGHQDGSIFLFSVSSTGTVTKSKLATHPRVPYCLSWGQAIMAAGSDSKIIFYDTKGNIIQRFDYTHDKNEKEFTVSEFSPSGTSVAVGSFNR